MEDSVCLERSENVGPDGQAHGSEGRETLASNPDDPERRSSVSRRYMVKAISNPASTVGIDGYVRGAGSRLGRIWSGFWNNECAARIRCRSTTPVGPDMCRSGSPHGQGFQTAVCCRSTGIETVPSPPVRDGHPASSTAGTGHPKAEPMTPNEASVSVPESRSVSKPSPNVSDASVSEKQTSIPTAS
ncbi:UNVERIFIED_CONTAM: hypothetical protein K2H54_047761 [Gekko kuhli]